MEENIELTAPEAQERDYAAEAAELLAERPELLGKSLPEEVTAASAAGKSLLAAYTDYENGRLKKENDILRQNEGAAEKAPVASVTAGGSARQSGSDPFLEGFNSEY